VDYIASKPEIIFAAFKGYENEEIALNTGMIVREMLRHESLCKILLYSEQWVSSFFLSFFGSWFCVLKLSPLSQSRSCQMTVTGES
jgi:hypothetical protein